MYIYIYLFIYIIYIIYIRKTGDVGVLRHISLISRLPLLRLLGSKLLGNSLWT